MKNIIKFLSPYLGFTLFLAILLLMPQKASSSEKIDSSSMPLETSETVTEVEPETTEEISKNVILGPASSALEIDRFLLPLNSDTEYTISSQQGMRGKVTATSGGRYHNAIDYAVPVGTIVLASKSGKVLNTSYNPTYGYYIIIEHDDGTLTLYAHLSDMFVHVGDTVSIGDTIGKSGETGDVTGPHLHFEAILNIDKFMYDNEKVHDLTFFNPLTNKYCTVYVKD